MAINMVKPRVIPITEELYPSSPDVSHAELLSLYAALRSDAQSLSRSRGYYASKVAHLRVELIEFAEKAKLSLEQKAELTSKMEAFGAAMTVLESAGDELVGGIHDYQHSSRKMTGGWPIGRLIRACYDFVRAWKLAKQMLADQEDKSNGVL